MGIAIEGIANYEDADYNRALVPADGYLKYYIGTAGSWRGSPMGSQEAEKIREQMKYIDGITGLAWKETYSESDAQIKFFKATSSYYDDPNTLGQTEYDSENGVIVTWLDETGGTLTNTEAITIRHEIGHVASLDHPYGDGFNASYTRADTVMSYNRSATGTVNWTDSDKLALKSIWG